MKNIGKIIRVPWQNVDSEFFYYIQVRELEIYFTFDENSYSFAPVCSFEPNFDAINCASVYSVNSLTIKVKYAN